MENSIEYRYEKYGAICLANWFISRGFEVGLSVPGPITDLRKRESIGGIVPPELSEFDTNDPQTRYKIYYDTPGNIDLVARNNEKIWVIEAKGLTKGRGAPGSIAEAIGQITMLIDLNLNDYIYGILLPKEDRYTNAVNKISDTNPLLSRQDFCVFWISENGEISRDTRFSVV